MPTEAIQQQRMSYSVKESGCFDYRFRRQSSCE